MIRSAKKRGYVTHDQINSVLPSEEVNSKQIADLRRLMANKTKVTPQNEEVPEKE